MILKEIKKAERKMVRLMVSGVATATNATIKVVEKIAEASDTESAREIKEYRKDIVREIKSLKNDI